MKRVNFILFLLLLSTLKIFGEGGPTNLYLDIANSISAASGNIDLHFTKGRWMKIINSKKVIINFSAGQNANLKFSYSGGQLQEGCRVVFSPAIHIWAKAPSGGLAIVLDTIWFDRNGKFAAWHVDFEKGKTDDLNLVAEIQEALRLNSKSENLFTIKILKNFLDAKMVDNKENIIPNKVPVLASIEIEKPNEAEPGLAVSLIPGSVLHFSSKISNGTFDNKIKLGSGNFEIRYLEYDLLNKRLDCEITKFDINVETGALETGNMLLNFGSGSRMKFNRLKIFSDRNWSEINAERGTLSVQVTSGTKFSLYKTSRYPSDLVFENGEINLFDFVYQSSNDNGTMFKIGGGSSLKVTTRSGSLSLCDNKGYLSLASGILEAKISGTWDSQESNPDAYLDISLLQVTLDGGYLPFAGDNSLGIKAGFIKSESLKFAGRNFSSVVGDIKDLNITVDDASKFKIPGSIQFSFREGGVINGAEPNHPLRLNTSNKYVSGLFNFNLKYSVFSSSSNETIKLKDGSVIMRIEVTDRDTIRGSNIFIDGNSSISGQGVSFNCRTEFSDGRLEYVRGLQPVFIAQFKFQITQGENINIKTPFLKMNDHNGRLFPVKLFLALSAPVISQAVNVKFTGQEINLDELFVSPHFNLIIPQGNGEHQNKDDENSDDGKQRGPDWSRVCQELYYGEFTLCHAHLYVLPQTAGLSTNMRLSISGHTISFQFAGIRFDNPFVEGTNWKKDGCDLPIIGAVAGAISGTILGGPFGTAIGAGAGLAAGIRADNIVEDRINTGISEALARINFNKQWKFEK